MAILTEIADNLLVEQDNKLEVIRKAIGERIPITINYTGPAGEVRTGQRIDIEPVVLGTNKKSGNLVIWAYVFKGVSKKGLPGWKMFRIDRITNAEFNKNVRFKLGSLPGYVKGKAPSAMRSLSNVQAFSPYWFEDEERFKEKRKPLPEPEKPAAPPTAGVSKEPSVPRPIEKPEITSSDLLNRIYAELVPKTRTFNGQRFVSPQDYQKAQNDLYTGKEQEFKVYQRQIGGNERPGEGTRRRFTQTSKAEIDKLLNRDDIKVSENPESLQEAIKIKSRFKRLINW